MTLPLKRFHHSLQNHLSQGWRAFCNSFAKYSVQILGDGGCICDSGVPLVTTLQNLAPENYPEIYPKNFQEDCTGLPFSDIVIDLWRVK